MGKAMGAAVEAAAVEPAAVEAAAVEAAAVKTAVGAVAGMSAAEGMGSSASSLSSRFFGGAMQ